jgi:hypothetical protein
MLVWVRAPHEPALSRVEGSRPSEARQEAAKRRQNKARRVSSVGRLTAIRERKLASVTAKCM